MANTPHITSIGFDLGGVIMAVSEAERFAFWGHKLGLPAETVATAWRACSPALEAGRQTPDEFWESIGTYLGQHISAEMRPSLWDSRDLHTSSARPELIALIDRLKTNGYRVGLLSNIYFHRDRTPSEERLFGHFGTVHLSSEIGAIKPEAESYQSLLEGLGSKPEETVFIDDLIENVRGAEAVGIIGLEFLDSTQLMQDLRDLGIKID